MTSQVLTHPTNKICKTCNKLKPVGDFRNYVSKKKNYIRNSCRKCCQEKIRKQRVVVLLRDIRLRCKEKNLPYDLDAHISELKERFSKKVCEVTGYPLDTENSVRAYNTSSIDRIDPKKGYVYDNIRIVCLAINMAFGNWGQKNFEKIVFKWVTGSLK